MLQRHAVDDEALLGISGALDLQSGQDVHVTTQFV
jgi:hypothetical protein